MRKYPFFFAGGAVMHLFFYWHKTGVYGWALSIIIVRAMKLCASSLCHSLVPHTYVDLLPA